MSHCHFCKIELSEFNKSMYKLFYTAKNNDKVRADCMCVLCAEVCHRILGVVEVTEEMEVLARADIEAEGWTIETLRAKEEKDFFVLN